MPVRSANLVARASDAPPNTTMISLLVVLLVLLIVALSLVGGLLYMRHRRRARRSDSESPAYDEKRTSTSSTLSSAHRRVMVRPSESVYVYQEKQNLIENSSMPPQSPLPEIHITFPEETDAAGKRVSGRVVVVRVGDNGVGLEPVENLPAYQQDDQRFESVDLERIGGLVDKARNAPSYAKFDKL